MRRIGFLGLLVALTAIEPARAGTKEELARLQSDVLALQNQIRMLDKSLTERSESLKSLVAQLHDQIGKSNQELVKITTALESRSSTDREAQQAVVKEVRNLGTKIDDTGVRIAALAQQIGDLKVQSKPVTARRFQSVGSDPAAAQQSADTIFFEAYNDLVQGNFDLAVQGFTAYLTSFPKSERADDAQFYIGDAYYNDGKLPQAIAAFTRVLNDYSTGDRAASALYKRALAEKQINERDNAIADLRAVIQRFPSSTEAGLAGTELESLGAAAAPSARQPAKGRRP